MGSERPMRRRDREISDPAELREILDANNCAVLSMIDGGERLGRPGRRADPHPNGG